MLSIAKNIPKLFGLAWDLQAITALLSWPIFSVTSYSMVSALKQQKLEPKTVLDIGANVGQFAIAVAKLFPDVRVHSFEPIPECFSKLRQNVSKLRNVSVYQIALGDTMGETICHVNSHSQSSSILPLAPEHRKAFPDAREIKQVPIKIATMDCIFAEKTLEPPVLLKLDVQGYEATVLRGGIDTLKRIEYVVAETSFKPLYQGESLFMELVMLMQSCGFQFVRPVGWLSNPKNGEVLQMDALFVRQV